MDVGSGAVTLVNGSPRLPRIQVPSIKDQESFDITLHRKDNEGFGFVILTSKSKPPPGGNSRFFDAPAKSFGKYIICTNILYH